jgi:hypothetical protein
VLRRLPQRGLHVPGLRDDVQVVLGVEHSPQPAADHRVIVGEDDLDPLRGGLPGAHAAESTDGPLIIQ